MTIWRITIGVIVTLLIAIGGWGMNRVATMPERHPTRQEFIRIADKIDKIYEYLIEGKH